MDIVGIRALFAKYSVYLSQGSRRNNGSHRKTIFHSASNPAKCSPPCETCAKHCFTEISRGGPFSTPLLASTIALANISNLPSGAQSVVNAKALDFVTQLLGSPDTYHRGQ